MYVQVDTGHNNIAGPAVEDHNGAVPVAEMGDLLGFQEARRIDRSPWICGGRGEDIKAQRAGEAFT